MNRPLTAEALVAPPVVLETVFAVSPDGGIYEIPKAEAARFRVSDARREELGHLPVLSYPELVARASGAAADGETVAGHHKVADASGGGLTPDGWAYHRDWAFGAYLDAHAGDFRVGFHRHPLGTDLAEAAGTGEFA